MVLCWSFYFDIATFFDDINIIFFYFVLGFPANCSSFHGPFSNECLNNIWKSVGCLPNGFSVPTNLAALQLSEFDEFTLKYDPLPNMFCFWTYRVFVLGVHFWWEMYLCGFRKLLRVRKTFFSHAFNFVRLKSRYNHTRASTTFSLFALSLPFYSQDVIFETRLRCLARFYIWFNKPLPPFSIKLQVYSNLFCETFLNCILVDLAFRALPQYNYDRSLVPRIKTIFRNRRFHAYYVAQLLHYCMVLIDLNCVLNLFL